MESGGEVEVVGGKGAGRGRGAGACVGEECVGGWSVVLMEGWEVWNFERKREDGNSIC